MTARVAASHATATRSPENGRNSVRGAVARAVKVRRRGGEASPRSGIAGALPPGGATFSRIRFRSPFWSFTREVPSYFFRFVDKRLQKFNFLCFTNAVDDAVNNVGKNISEILQNPIFVLIVNNV